MICLKSILLLGLISLSIGCVPIVEDTTPSAALFPTKGNYAYTTVGASAQINNKADFSGLLKLNAPRRKVELTAVHGAHFNSRKSRSDITNAWEEIESGSYLGKDGKQVYRVNTIGQAQQILKTSWTKESWAANSNLATTFQKLPNASVVKLSPTDQRILFFDKSNRLVGCYPSAN